MMLIEKNVIKIKIDTISDMKEIYSGIINNSFYDTKKCPIIITDLELSKNNDYEIYSSTDGLNKIILTRKGLSVEDVLTILTENAKLYQGTVSYVDDEMFDLLYTKNDMKIYYAVAYYLAKSLKIRCPQVLVNNSTSGMNGITYNTLGTEGKTVAIVFKDHSKRGIVDVIETLAHEMRHCWQHETNPIKFFKEYKTYDKFESNDQYKYYLQPAEIDAYAYAQRFIGALLNENFTSTSRYPQVRTLTNKRANHIDSKFLGTKTESKIKDYIVNFITIENER